MYVIGSVIGCGGNTAEGIAYALDLLADARSNIPKLDDVLQLVMSGPQMAGIERRDTSVVVSGLFRNARKSVLIAGYAVYQGRRVFSELAKRMDELPVSKFGCFWTSRGNPAIRRFLARLSNNSFSAFVPKNGRTSPDCPRCFTIHGPCLAIGKNEPQCTRNV